MVACTRQMLAEGSEALLEPSVPEERPSGQKKEEGPSRCPVSFPGSSSSKSLGEVCCGVSQPAQEGEV